MIAIRTHWNPAEAALEKTLLDNYEVPCALLYENANLFCRRFVFCEQITQPNFRTTGRCEQKSPP
jgi:hypothetical protein